MARKPDSFGPDAIGRASATLGGALSRRHLMELAGTAIPVALAGCMGATDDQGGSPTATTPTPPLPGTVRLSQAEGFVGDTIEVQASGLPANRELEVVWETVQGRWALIADRNIVGPKFAPGEEVIATATTDAQGRLSASYTIPEDYGGSHDVTVQTAAGTPLAKAAFELLPEVTIDRTTAPIGGTFTVETHGMEPMFMHLSHAVCWDNSYGGLITTVRNRGHGVAQVRAAGPPGTHHIQVRNALQGLPFLMMDQSPYGAIVDGRNHTWVVEVTEPERELPVSWSDPLRDATPLESFFPELDEPGDASLSLSQYSGTAGTTVTIRGEGFPTGERVDLVWYSIEGSRVSPDPISDLPKPEALPSVTTLGDGTFELEISIPADKGGTRPIVAEVGGRSVAVTGFVLQPKIAAVEPAEGPIGTPFEVHMSGLGWTEHGNTYALLWDNQYLGYGCGMDDSGGVVRYNMEATGPPGLHFIDMYPGLYRADESPPDMYGGKAQLTSRHDHPGHPVPALHATFRVTE